MAHDQALLLSHARVTRVERSRRGITAHQAAAREWGARSDERGDRDPNVAHPSSELFLHAHAMQQHTVSVVSEPPSDSGYIILYNIISYQIVLLRESVILISSRAALYPSHERNWGSRFTILRMRADITGNAHMKYVGKSQT